MSESEMKNTVDFRPKQAMVRAGNTEMVAREYVIGKRDEIFNVVLSGLDLASMVGKLIGGYNKLEEARSKAVQDGQDFVGKTSDYVDANEIGAKLVEFIVGLFTKNLTEIACITLDNDENRKIVGAKDQSALHGWLKANMTWAQETQLLRTILEVNDVRAMVKNYLTLVTGMMATGAEPSEVSE